MFQFHDKSPPFLLIVNTGKYAAKIKQKFSNIPLIYTIKTILIDCQSIIWVNLETFFIVLCCSLPSAFRTMSDIFDVYLTIILCAKIFRIRRYSDPYFPAFGLNIQLEQGKIWTRITRTHFMQWELTGFSS